MSDSLQKQWTSTKIVLIYLVSGCLWILLSDRILEYLLDDPEARRQFELYKGWLYVFVTGAMLYVLIERGLAKTRALEAARLATGRRVDEFVENAQDLIFTLDAGGKFTSMNGVCEKFTGYRREELLGRDVAELLGPGGDYYRARLLEADVHRTSLVDEIKVRRRDGSAVLWEVSCTPLDEHGRPTGTQCIARDVTQRRAMQRALEESELRYKKLIETANEAIWAVDADFRVTLINTKMCETIGLRAEEVLDRPLLDFIDERRWAEAETYFARQRAGERDQIDYHLRRPDGREVWLIISANPIVNDGEFQGVLYMATDITERKRYETLRRESEERFRVLFEQSAVGGMIVGEGLKIIDCNEIGASMLGYTREEMKQLAVYDFDAGYSTAEIEGIVERINRDGQMQFETLHRTKSGELRNVLVASTQLKIEGKIYGYSSFLDITEKKRAEEELRREKERMESTALASPSVIYSFRFTPDGKPCYPYASPAIFGIYGRQPAELEDDASAVVEMIHPDDVPRLVESSRRSAETMSLWNEIWRVNHPAKGELWVESFSVPVREVDGSLTWHGVLNDVTTRERKERELSERQRMISAINNAAPGLILLWDVRLGTVVYANDGLRKMLGFSPDEIYRHDSGEIFARIHPADRPAVAEFGKRLRCAADDEVLSQEFRYLNKAGQWRVLQSQETIFERDAEGRAVKTLSVVNDVTERVLAVEALRKSEQRLQKIHRIVSESCLTHRERIMGLLELGVGEFGTDNGVLGEVSDETYSVAEVVSLDQTIVSGFRCPLQQSYCEEVLRREDVLAIENAGGTPWREHPAHELFGTEVYFGVPVLSAGKPYGTICFTSRRPRAEAFTSGDYEFLKLIAQWVGAELTRQAGEEALQQSEEQLRLAQKLESVGRLAGGIAHDFNNMLTAINGYSDLILQQSNTEDPVRHNAEEIKKAGERSAALTQQLLAFSRKQILKPEILNINQAVDDISNLLKRLIGEDVTLMTILGYDVKPVKVDPGQLSQVVVNLAVNARDAMPQGGTLTIETKNVSVEPRANNGSRGVPPGDYVMMSVSDTGIGMSEETMRHLFEPFYTTKDVGRGTGLGLATVYGVIKQSDGFITVDSAPGEGTTFRIFLPRVEAPVEETAVETSAAGEREGGETILLVEDEEMVRNLASEILQSCGYRVVEATTGVEAIEICESRRLEIDLLLTDVVMPQMNGRELWEKLATEQPRMKVLFTSGYTDDTIVRNGIRNDETNFLQKPFSLDALVRKVREVLDAEEPAPH